MNPREADLSYVETSRIELRYLGSVLLLVGIALSAMWAHDVAGSVLYLHGEARGQVVGGISVIFGLFLFLAAMAFTTRRWISVDLEEGTVTASTVFFDRVHAQELPITSDGSIVHQEVQVRQQNARYTEWVVSYTCADGTVELQRRLDSRKSRAWAERYAGELDVPLVEIGGGALGIRRPSSLDQSVVEQGLAEDLDWPDQPISRRVRWTPKGRNIEVVISPPGFNQRTCFGVVMTITCVALLWKLRAHLPIEGHAAALAALVVYGGTVLFTGWVGALLLTKTLWHEERWSVGPRGIQRTGRRGALMPTCAIEQIEVEDNSALSVRGDGDSLSIGEDLTQLEVRDLRAVLLLALSHE